MKNDDDFARVGDGDEEDNSESLYFDELDADSDIDYDEFVEKFHNEFEQTQRAYADSNTIKESLMEVKKIIFKKQNDAMKKYDKKLVLKEFVREQHRKIGRLDLWSHRKQFFDPESLMYSLPDILNFVEEAAKVKRASQPIMNFQDQEEDPGIDDKNEFTCLATKLDEYIKRVDEKTFKQIFLNGCNIRKKKEKTIYEFVNWQLNIKDARQIKVHKMNSLLKSIKRGLTASIQDEVENQKNIMSYRGTKKRVGLVKLLALKFNIKTKTLRMDIVQSQNKFYLVQTNNTGGILRLIIYKIEDDKIDWRNCKKLDICHDVSNVLDVTNKVFKDFENHIYYFECEDNHMTLKKLCLDSMILHKVEIFEIPNAQCVTYFHDAIQTHYSDENSWLSAQWYAIILKDGHYDIRAFWPIKQINGPNQIALNKFDENHQFLFAVQKNNSFGKFIYCKANERPSNVYLNQKEYKSYIDKKEDLKILDDWRKECEDLFQNIDHQVIYNDGIRKPLLDKGILAIQEEIFEKKIEDESLNHQFVIHQTQKKQSFLINCDLISVEMTVVNYICQKQEYIQDFNHMIQNSEQNISPLETMTKFVRQRRLVAIQVSSQFRNIFFTPERDIVFEVANDEQGKNKVIEYLCEELEYKEENKIEYVFPFYHIFQDLNIPNCHDQKTSLHNYHMGINENLFAHFWPKIGSESFFPKNYLQLAKSQKITYQKKGRYMRNFQVSQRYVTNDLKFQWWSIKEFQFLTKGDNPKIAQIGQKLVILNFNCNCEVDFLPLYREDTACIFGTQLRFIHKQSKGGQNYNDVKRLPLENFKQKDYQFRSKLASSGYQRICLDGINQDAVLIIDCKLNNKITDINRVGFQLDHNERDMVIKSQLKNILNMIPLMNVFELVHHGKSNEECFDFFQPQEYLKGKCRANYYSRKEKDIYAQIGMIQGNEIDPSILKDSIIQQYIKNSIQQVTDHELSQQDLRKKIKESSLLHSLGEQGWIREPFEIINDLNHQNVIEDAMNFEKNELAFKMLFDFAYEQRKSKEIYDTFTRVLFLAFNEKITFTDCLFKFINDNSEIRGNFYVALDLQNAELPKFSSEEHSLAEFDIHNIKHHIDPLITDEQIIKAKYEELYIKDDQMLSEFHDYPTDYNKVEFMAIHKQFINEFSPLGIIQVQHFIIDFRSVLLNEKLMILKGKRPADMKVQFTEFDFAMLIYSINRKFTNSIEDQNSIRALIDFQFDRTKSFYHNLFITFILFHGVPFFWQLIFLRDPAYIRMCLFSCTIRQIISLIIESIKIKMIGRKYFFKSELKGRCQIGFPIWENLINLGNLGLFFVYVYFQFRTPYTTLGNRNAFSKETLRHGITDYDKFINILLCFNVLQIVLQCNYFMQVYQSFGLLRQLIIICIKDMIPFTIYMLMFLIMFALFYKVLGVNISITDYPGMNDFGMFFMDTFENSIGNVYTPDVKVWHNSDNRSQFEISTIYIIWLCNQFMTTIVLMNFLIAVISQSYENVMNKLQVHTYRNRASMNYQYYQIMEFYQFSKKLTLVLLQSRTTGIETEGGEADEWKGFVQTLKKFLRQKLTPMAKKLDIVTLSINKLYNELDNVKERMATLKTGQSDIRDDIKVLMQEMRKTNSVVAEPTAHDAAKKPPAATPNKLSALINKHL